MNAIDLIDANHADVLAHGQIDIDGKTLETTGARLQSLGDIHIQVDQLNNRAGLIRSGGHLNAAADAIDNRDTRTASGADPLGLIAGSVDLATDSLLNQSGAVIAAHDLNIVVPGQIQNAQGLLSAGGTLDIRETPTAMMALSTAAPNSPVARSLSITNTGGTLIADQQLAVTTKTLSLDGAVLSQGDMTLSVQGDHTHAAGSRIVANRDLTLDIEDGGLLNSGELLAGRNLGFTANALANTGDPKAQQDIERAAGAMADYVANPDNWPYLLGAMTPETREQLAQAYERGDGATIGSLMGAQALEILGNTPVVGGAGIIKKVDKASDAAKLAEAAEAAEAAEKAAVKATGNTPVDIAHTIGADYNPRTGKVTGGHTLLNGDVRVAEVVGLPDVNGVYEAKVEMKAPDGTWIEKSANGGVNTMFPKDWNASKVRVEIESAWTRRTPVEGKPNMWQGTSDSGVKIQGYLDPRTTAFPVMEQRP